MSQLVTVCCSKCSFCYSLREERVGIEDPYCRNKKNPGVLLKAPPDAKPGEYYHPSQGVNCFQLAERYR